MQWKKDPENKFLYFLNFFTCFPVWFVVYGYFALIMSTIGQFRWDPLDEFRFKEWKVNFTSKQGMSSNFLYLVFYIALFGILASWLNNYFIIFLIYPFIWIALFEIVNYLLPDSVESKRKFSIFSTIKLPKFFNKNIEITD